MGSLRIRNPKQPFTNRATYPVKCPSCKAKIQASDYKNDPWSKVDKHGEGFYVCPSCGKNLVHRWTIGPSFVLLLIVVGPIVYLLSEILAFAALWLIGTISDPGESTSEAVTFLSYALVAGVTCLYIIQPVEVEAG